MLPILRDVFTTLRLLFFRRKETSAAIVRGVLSCSPPFFSRTGILWLKWSNVVSAIAAQTITTMLDAGLPGRGVSFQVVCTPYSSLKPTRVSLEL